MRLPFRTGIPSEDVGAKQIHTASAGWAVCLHDPEVIQDLTCPFLGILGTVEGAELVANRVRKFVECDLDASPIEGAKSDTYSIDRNGIDVAAKSR